MFYPYKCEKCGAETIIMQNMKDVTPKKVICEKCGNNAYRDWSGIRIHIPEDFKATSDITGGDSYANSSNLKERFKKSRPSGKEKIYY